MSDPDTPSVSSPSVASLTWLRRLRFLAAAALVWAGLHFILGGRLLPPGLNRPATVAVANSPIVTAVVVALILWAGTYVGTLIAGAAHRWQALTIVCLALAAWAAPRGTMDHWLILAAPEGVVAPPTGSVYWPLFDEYLYLLVVMLGVTAIGALAVPAAGSNAASLRTRVRRAFALDADRKQRVEGLLALLITTAVIGVLMLVLTGPLEAETLRGQVYFAVTVSCALAVFIATRLVRVRHPIWYWPAPIVAGLLGMLVAALNPDILIPAEYRQLNSIAAWGLSRPLPIEMVGVGVAITIWTVRATTGGSQPEAA